jgi:hypothetical protein
MNVNGSERGRAVKRQLFLEKLIAMGTTSAYISRYYPKWLLTLLKKN